MACLPIASPTQHFVKRLDFANLIYENWYLEVVVICISFHMNNGIIFFPLSLEFYSFMKTLLAVAFFLFILFAFHWDFCIWELYIRNSGIFLASISLNFAFTSFSLVFPPGRNNAIWVFFFYLHCLSSLLYLEHSVLHSTCLSSPCALLSYQQSQMCYLICSLCF
jgi:hypothetical protein